MKDKSLLDLNYTFVYKDAAAPTSLMKCVLPSNAIKISGGSSQHITVKEFIKQAGQGAYDSKSVIVFLKIGNNLDKETIDAVEKIKNNVLGMFCDVNDNYEFLIEELSGGLEHSRKAALKFLEMMDGILYESSDLKGVIKKYNSSLVTLKVRHPHTNCINELNPHSGIEPKGDLGPLTQAIKISDQFGLDGIFNFGYLGRPKQCTDFLRITRAVHDLNAQAKFIQSNPNVKTNMSLTSEIDLGFSLYDFDDWNRKLKPANKIMNYWSVGIPCMMSPYTSYKDVFKENDLDFSYYEIPSIDFSKHEGLSRREISLREADSLCQKIALILSDGQDFHERRTHLWKVSLRYNPMNIEFLYEGMFNHIRGNL